MSFVAVFPLEPGVPTKPAQGLARHLPVVEGQRAVAELLALLVALAGDDDDVALARALDRAGDRGAPVELDLDVADDAGQDLVDDRLRVLAARVVGGHD